MKRILLIGLAVWLMGCAEDRIEITRTIETSDGPIKINCDPEPNKIYDHLGNLMKIVYPPLPPSCRGGTELVGNGLHKKTWYQFGRYAY